MIRLPLEDVDAEIFSDLEENDILFFDGSHRSFMNSDVSAFFLDIIPKLKSGVLLQIHDVFLPFDYPAVWKERYYSEQYILACYMLAESQKFQVVFPSCFIAVDTELSLELSSLWRVLDSRIQKTGASFWLRIN